MKPDKLIGFVGFVALALILSGLPVFAQRGQTVMLSEGTRLTLRLNDDLTTKTARPGDRFTAEVVTPVYRRRALVVPAGSTVMGRVAHAKQAGRIRGRAEMCLRFERLHLPNGAEEPIVARFAHLDRRERKEVEKEGTVKGQGTKKRDAAVVGTAGGVGAGVGAIAGGAKGTAIGAGIGALIGLGTVLATRGKDAELPRGTEFDIILDRPLRLPVDR